MRKWIRILPAVILLTACLLGMVPAHAESDELHYGIGGSLDRILPGDELFALLFPEQAELSEAERNYLCELFSLTYNDTIDENLIDSKYDEEQGILTVRAEEYVYDAVNGTTVRWIPQTVSMNGEEEQPFVLENGVYQVLFRDLWHSKKYRLDVRYTWQIGIDETIADRMLTVCYDTAEETLQEILAWEAYQEQKTAYDAWRDYPAKKQAYDEYQTLLQSYLSQKQAYDAYCAALADYNARVAAYEAIKEEKAAYIAQETAYYAYENSRKVDAENYAKYETYQFYLEEINKRLNILDTLFVRESHYWCFYASLVGRNVQSILDRREELVRASVKGEWVDRANQATQALRVILGEYDTLRKAEYATELERVTTLFSFYTAHYSELQWNIRELYENISNIFMYSIVQNTLRTEGSEKLPHFKQFIAHLYMLSACLDDSEVLDMDLQIKLVGSVREWIEDKILLVDDNKSSPAGVVIPTEEVLLGDLPEPVEKPEKKEFPEDPREKEKPPVPVANPGAAPTPVADPGKEPAEVADPGERKAPTIDPLCRALAEELRSGTLLKRTSEKEAKTLSLSKTVICNNRSILNQKNVTFYGTDGEILDEQSVEYDSMITPPSVAARYEDARAYYTFLGWVSEGSQDLGDIVDFDTLHIRKHQSFRPLFREELKYYQIAWKIADRTYTMQYTYGEIPKCSESTVRSSDENEYTFTGWTPEIQPVSENATYTACYTVKPRTFMVTWDLGVERITQECKINTFPTYAGSTDREPDDYTYTFIGWEPALSAVTHDVTYTAQYLRTPISLDRSGKVNEISHTEKEMTVIVEGDHVDFRNAATCAEEIGKTLKIRFDGLEIELDSETLQALKQTGAAEIAYIRLQTDSDEEFSFRVVLRNTLGMELPELSVNLRMTMCFSTVNALVYRMDQGEPAEVETLRSSFTGETNAVYLARSQFSISYTGENCDLHSLISRAYAGQEILLKGNCTYGYEIVGAVLTLANGETQTVGKTFVMPTENLEIALLVEPIVYHVTFVADGVILREDTYGFDETIILPEDPVKGEDETNRYAFIGWTPYVTRTVGDDRNPVYTAVFSASPREFAQPTGGGIGLFFRSALFWCLVAAVVILIGGIVLAVILIRRKKRARKTNPSAPEGTASEPIETKKEPESPEKDSDGSGSDEI